VNAMMRRLLFLSLAITATLSAADHKLKVSPETLAAPGAMFEVGDGHARQVDGEVDITAMETSLTGLFHFIVHHDRHLNWPRAETPTHYVTMGSIPISRRPRASAHSRPSIFWSTRNT
jgi:hypothetical protein